MIIAYYASGFRDQSVFGFQNLYLYGGLFDIVAVALSHLVPIDPYDLRHILCALIGIGGIGAAAATARLIAGPRAAPDRRHRPERLRRMVRRDVQPHQGHSLRRRDDGRDAVPDPHRAIPAVAALGDVAAFGLLAGAALGMRVLGLLLVIYAGVAIALYLPRPWFGQAARAWRFAVMSSVRLLPALLLAYVIMILAWPWAALAPLNPVRGLLAFSEFQYDIRTILAGQVYEMADAPRLYVPIYILIRVPLLTLFGAALAILFTLLPRLARRCDRSCSAGISPWSALTVMFPLACQVIWRGPAFTGMRHFLFVIPALAVLAGIGLDKALTALATRGRVIGSGGLAVMAAGFLLDAVTLVRLHPYEYLFYNPVVGGLQGASRRYDLDYWFGSMPEAINQLEAYLRRTEPTDADRPAPGLFRRGVRRTPRVRQDRHASATALGFQAAVGPVASSSSRRPR